MNDQVMKQLKKNQVENIKKQCNKLFLEYKQKGLDIFYITDDFHRRYPHESTDNIIKKSDLDLEIYVNIEGASDVNNFK